MSAPFRIRPVRPAEEAEAVWALLRAAHAWNAANGFVFWASEASVEGLRPKLQAESFWVAESPEGALWGSVAVAPSEGLEAGDRFQALPGEGAAWPEGWALKLLGVAPEAQGQGVGQALVAHAEAIARAGGAERLLLDTPAEHPWLPDFYRRLGYRDLGAVWWRTRSYRSVLLGKAL